MAQLGGGKTFRIKIIIFIGLVSVMLKTISLLLGISEKKVFFQNYRRKYSITRPSVTTHIYIRYIPFSFKCYI